MFSVHREGILHWIPEGLGHGFEDFVAAKEAGITRLGFQARSVDMFHRVTRFRTTNEVEKLAGS